MSGTEGGGTGEIHISSVPWRTNTEQILEAAMGPPMWILRKRQIEDAQEKLERDVGAAWRLCAHRYERERDFSQRWQEELRTFDLDPLTALIETHNRWYPAEANLPSDPRTREIIDVTGEPFRPLPLPSHAALLERFPPERARALAGE